MKINLAAGLLLFAPCVIGAQGQPDPAQSRVVLDLPGMADVVVEKDVAFSSSASPQQYFDLYRPKSFQVSTPLPAVVFVSGAEDVRAWKWFQSYGQLTAVNSMIGIIPTKRYPRGFPGIVSGYGDTEAILKHLKTNAAALGIDPDRICVWAFSAGGRLMSAAFKSLDPVISCVVGYYPVADLTGEFAGVADTVQRNGLLAKYSPSHTFASRGAVAPPVLIARAGKDGAVINMSIDRFLAAAVAANADVTFINYPDGLHGFDAYNDTDRSRQIIRDTFDFIARSTSRARAAKN